jgi:hypothetical protein
LLQEPAIAAISVVLSVPILLELRIVTGLGEFNSVREIENSLLPLQSLKGNRILLTIEVFLNSPSRTCADPNRSE